MATTDNLKGLTDEALTHKMLEAERDLVRARFQHSMGQLENTSTLGVLRRSIARIKTEARNREIANDLPKDSLLAAHRKSFTAPTADSAEQGSEERGGFLQGIVDKLTGKD